jgi:hypothetical protein
MGEDKKKGKKNTLWLQGNNRYLIPPGRWGSLHSPPLPSCMGEDKKKEKIGKWASSGCDEDKYFCLLKNKTTLSIWVVGDVGIVGVRRGQTFFVY